MKPIRVSTIEFLNTVPLTWSLLREQPPELEFLFTVPSKCAEQVASSEAEVGIIPSIEYQRIEGLSVLAGPGIVSRERVRSILLLTSKRPAEIETVAADTSSRTSLALTELLLRCRHHRPVRMVPHAPDPRAMLAACDAAVIIGDPALIYSENPLPGVTATDLVQEWRAWTGLPFVFAFWAARPEAATPRMASLFAQARDRGVDALAEIIPAEAARRGLPEALVRDYLTNCICYDMDAQALAGLDMFYRLAAEHGLIARANPLKIVPAPVPAQPVPAVTEKAG